ncbi:MAG: ABC transporter ATP-binding protein [Bacteroidales bacterium]|jgi:ABC-type multidrug transport system ATPase subunit|nr:ABC transporter ATP-binding protein [Bacteroidales bacterium]MBQ4477053.1 ABC transporter ATP-binding protein [Bacteroidales bacterium]MBR4452963.1 ABC transporter ATP-binding protein [Bacteroidales bacterium]
MKAIEVAEISKSFGKIKALDKVSLTVEEGELFGLIGPDAAGKSTLFNILVTLLNPDQGDATILGLNLMKDYKKLRQMIGYLPGQFSLYGDLSCWENLEFFATMYGESIEENYDLIKPIWEQLQPFKNRKASALSGGMKQKLALCCALIHKPKVLFLDEPTTGVDPVSRKELWEILQKMKSVGITVFVSTSYMDEATICNRIALIQKGEILGSAKPQQIIDAYQGYLLAIRTDNIYQLLQFLKDYPARNIYASGQYVNVVFNDKGEADKMIEVIEKNNIQIRSKEFIQPTIEDCFIQLMRKKDE